MDAPAARLHLDAVITPNRSLPARGFLVLIAVIVAMNVIVGTLFVSMGAPVVPIFLGLDVLGVLIAFRASYRQAKARERVQVTADLVKVLHERGARGRLVWSSPTAFTRVALEDLGRDEAEVRLIISGRRLAIGRALGPMERKALAVSVEQAIRSARAERYEG
jgi:uncharacterized membrane protein